MININWNDHVTLKPNSRGWEIWREHYLELCIAPPPHNETIEMEIWAAAKIWGPSFTMGAKPVFDSMIMEYRKLCF